MQKFKQEKVQNYKCVLGATRHNVFPYKLVFFVINILWSDVNGQVYMAHQGC
jgi:hypothetical protein